MPVTSVLGVDSSTQSTKALLVDAADGTVLARQGAPHPPGTEVDPRAWLQAYDAAAGGLLPRAAALGVAGQQHGMVARDAAGEPVRDALLWNDTRSAGAAADLIAEHGGPQACADAVGACWSPRSPPPSCAGCATTSRPPRPGWPTSCCRTTTSRCTPARRDGAVHGPRGRVGHRLLLAPRRGSGGPTWPPRRSATRWRCRASSAPGAVAGETASGAVVSAGTGDNMGAALGLSLSPATSSCPSAPPGWPRR